MILDRRRSCRAFLSCRLILPGFGDDQRVRHSRAGMMNGRSKADFAGPTACGAKRTFVDIRCRESETEANRSGSDDAPLILGSPTPSPRTPTNVHPQINFFPA